MTWQFVAMQFTFARKMLEGDMEVVGGGGVAVGVVITYSTYKSISYNKKGKIKNLHGGHSSSHVVAVACALM